MFLRQTTTLNQRKARSKKSRSLASNAQNTKQMFDPAQRHAATTRRRHMFLAVQCDVWNRHTSGVGDCKRVTSHQRCTQTFLRTQHRHWNQWTVVQLDEYDVACNFQHVAIFLLAIPCVFDELCVIITRSPLCKIVGFAGLLPVAFDLQNLSSRTMLLPQCCSTYAQPPLSRQE